MQPTAFVIAIQVGLNEVPSAGALRIAPVLYRVLHVCHFGFELGHQELRCVQERKAKVARSESCCYSTGFKLCRVCKRTCVLLSRCHQLCPSEGRHVHNEVEALKVLCGMSYAVPQDKPALGITVVHLNSLPRVHRQNVIIAEGVGADSIFCEAQNQIYFLFGTKFHCSHKSSQHPSRPPHVTLHPRHASLALERQTARVVDNALPNQGHSLRDLLVSCRVILHDDHARRTYRRLAHTVKAAVSPLPQVIPGNHGYSHGIAKLLGDLGTLIRKGLSGELGRGGVHEPSGQAHRLCRRRSGADGFVVLHGPALLVQERDADVQGFLPALLPLLGRIGSLARVQRERPRHGAREGSDRGRSPRTRRSRYGDADVPLSGTRLRYQVRHRVDGEGVVVP
mmetsp:Transcript_21742/g.44004  ORF Transcript_21742/g.44004 Transcript_21742/m.44004 type:complete len:395 (-) Transcript_21742:562-1746(-)